MVRPCSLTSCVRRHGKSKPYFIVNLILPHFERNYTGKSGNDRLSLGYGEFTDLSTENRKQKTENRKGPDLASRNWGRTPKAQEFKASAHLTNGKFSYILRTVSAILLHHNKHNGLHIQLFNSSNRIPAGSSKTRIPAGLRTGFIGATIDNSVVLNPARRPGFSALAGDAIGPYPRWTGSRRGDESRFHDESGAKPERFRISARPD
jgi:hypothetical protein